MKSKFCRLEYLRWHPSNRKELLVIVKIVLPVHIVSYPQVRHLDSHVWGDDTVTSGKVSVYDHLGGKVGHAIGRLLDNMEKVLLCQSWDFCLIWAWLQEELFKISLLERRREECEEWCNRNFLNTFIITQYTHASFDSLFEHLEGIHIIYIRTCIYK